MFAQQFRKVMKIHLKQHTDMELQKQHAVIQAMLIKLYQARPIMKPLILCFHLGICVVEFII